MDAYCFLTYFFFFNDTATTEIYTLSLHDALPIWPRELARVDRRVGGQAARELLLGQRRLPGAHLREQLGDLVGLDRADVDRKSTRLNSSHANISYAVFCLKKKKIPTDSIIVRVIM